MLLRCLTSPDHTLPHERNMTAQSSVPDAVLLDHSSSIININIKIKNHPPRQPSPFTTLTRISEYLLPFPPPTSKVKRKTHPLVLYIPNHLVEASHSCEATCKGLVRRPPHAVHRCSCISPHPTGMRLTAHRSRFPVSKVPIIEPCTPSVPVSPANNSMKNDVRQSQPSQRNRAAVQSPGGCRHKQR